LSRRSFSTKRPNAAITPIFQVGQDIRLSGPQQSLPATERKENAMAILPNPDPTPTPVPPPPPIPEPKPVREPDPDRLPDEAPLPNPDENDAPPKHVVTDSGACRT
jgi:outer membrane biosynthesis protein TonB